MIEMVTKISQAEEAATRIKKDATVQAAQMEERAHQEGKAELLRLKAINEAEAAKIVAAAEAEAARHGSAQLETARDESRELAGLASTKLEKAASLIVERIVETK